MSALIVGLLGIASSIVTELVTWLNKVTTGTVLQGKGAFIVSLFLAFVGAAFRIGFTQSLSFGDWHAWATIGSQIWAVSQVYFVLIAQTFGLEVKE